MLNIKTPKSWRKGQVIFNFLEWLATEKGVPYNQNERLADTFHVTDEEMDKYVKEFESQFID